MPSLRDTSSIIVLVLGASLLCAGACGSDAEPAKAQGTEGASCFPNSTCMAGLVCLSNLCVNPGTGGSAGADGGKDGQAGHNVGGNAGGSGPGGSGGTAGGAGLGGTAGVGGVGGVAGSAGLGGVAGQAGFGGGCTKTSCAAEGKNCGEISDGCGATLSCGTCSGAEVCSGGGELNVCGTPTFFYVALNGKDSNDGSEASPWRTIQHAVATISAGQTIRVRAGTYKENVTLSLSGQATKYITLTNYPNEVVVLDGRKNAGACDYGSEEPALRTNGAVSYWLVEGLEIANVCSRYALRFGWFGEAATSYLVLRKNKIRGATFTVGDHNTFEENEYDGTGYEGTEGDAAISDSYGGFATHHNIYRNNVIHDYANYNARGIWTQGYTHDHVIEGNTITNISSSIGGSLGQCIDLDGAGTVEWRHTVRNNTVKNCQYVGIQLENAFACVIENNTIEEAKSAGIIVINYDSGVGCKKGGENDQYGDTNDDNNCKGDPTQNVLRQNVIFNQSGGWPWGYGGIVNWYAGALSILGNTIYAPSGSGNGGINFQSGSQDGGILRNNLIHQGNDVAICATDLSSFAQDDHNLLYSGDLTKPVYGTGSGCTGTYTVQQYQSATSKGQGSVQQAPSFKAPASSDFHLLPGSPAIDQGVNIGTTTDRDGNPRPQGAGVDIGAYEAAP